MSDDVKPYTRQELDAEIGDELGGPLERQFRALGIPETVNGLPNRAAHVFYGNVRRLILTARTGTADREKMCEDVLGCIPDSWLDPLLTGPHKVFASEIANPGDIERLLRALKARVNSVMKCSGRHHESAASTDTENSTT